MFNFSKSILSIFITFTACYSLISCSQNSKSSTTPKLDYVSTLEYLINDNSETDDDKIEVMAIYQEVGGSDASKERASEICDSLRSGSDFKQVEHDHSLRAIRDIGLSGRAWTDKEMEKISYAGSLYLAEVYAAQLAICPETEVEVELNLE